MKTRIQYGAIPVAADPATGIQVLLLTSRGTGRWVIPKGWPMRRRSPAQAAAREAFEEAGVKGTTSDAPIGTFEYAKALRGGGFMPCQVTVFVLWVTKELRKWPEQAQRRRQWFTPEDAAALVDEPDLAALLRAIGAAREDVTA